MDWTLEVVTMQVADVDRAKAFYADRVGFAVDHDTPLGEQRMVQLTPPGSGCSVVVMGPAEDTGTPLRLQLVVDDLDAARAQLVTGGVEASEIMHFGGGADPVPGRGGRWNAFVFFEDPDGNHWAVQERPSAS